MNRSINENLDRLYWLLYHREQELKEIEQDLNALKRSVKLLEKEEFGL